MDEPELGKSLVEEGLITQAQLKKALDVQQDIRGRLPVVLAKLGIVNERKLIEFFSRRQNLPIVDLDELVLPTNLIKRIPKDIMERHQILPVAWKSEEKTLVVATFDPYDIQALEEVQIAVECKVVINLATRSQIVRVINDFFRREGGDREESPVKKDPRREKELLGARKEALLHVLIEKKIVTEQELDDKAKQMGLIKP